MYSREKLTIKGRASRRVFPPKNTLQTKRPVFYSPGEFTGRRSETHLHKRKVEILRFRAKRELSSNLPPKRKNRPEDRSAENFEIGGQSVMWATRPSQTVYAQNHASNYGRFIICDYQYPKISEKRRWSHPKLLWNWDWHLFFDCHLDSVMVENLKSPEKRIP